MPPIQKICLSGLIIFKIKLFCILFIKLNSPISYITYICANTIIDATY